MTSRWWLAGLVAFAACTDTRQITLSIDTTAGIPCDIDHIRVRTMASRGETFDRDVTDGRFPISIALSDRTPHGSFDLEVFGVKDGIEVLHMKGSMQFGAGDADLVANVMLDTSCSMDVPCEIAAPVQAGAQPAVSPAPRTKCVSQYAVQDVPSEIFQDVCPAPGASQVLTDPSRRAEEIASLGDILAKSDFQFYGEPIRHIWAHRNGYLAFGTNGPDPLNALFAGPLDRAITGTGAAPPRRAALAFWDTLGGSIHGVCYALSGAPGMQKLRVTWSQTCPGDMCTSSQLNFTIVLDEQSHSVTFTYGGMKDTDSERTRGGSATVGLVKDAIGCPVAECTLATGLCSDGATPCGYSQVFSNVPQKPFIQDITFVPVADPK